MRIQYFSPGGLTKKLKHLNALIGGVACTRLSQATHVVGWGYRPSGRLAQALAKQHGLKMLYLEDGLLSACAGLNTATHRLSVAVDSRAPYFDTALETDLEQLIKAHNGPKEATAGHIERWRKLGLSKYGNAHAPAPAELAQARAQGREVVVLLDQLAGDASLAPRLTGARPFERMVQEARARHPEALLVVKRHPREGERQGWFTHKKGVLGAMLKDERLRDACVCGPDVALHEVLSHASVCYAVTSQAGFEALLWGVPVVCVGHPWYAGWGVTQDLYTPARRQGLPKKSVAGLFEAAFAQYCRYVHPATGAPLTWDAALAHAELQAQVRQATPSHVAVVDAQPWKKKFYRDFMPDAQVRFIKAQDVATLGTSDTVLVTWGQRTPQWEVDAWRKEGYRVLQCEDGFLRSIGLGCELVRPLSLSFDPKGLYADAQTASELPKLVAQPLSEAQYREARRFIRLHRNLRLTKYLGTARYDGVHWAMGQEIASAERKMVLLCGQVSDDVSVKTANCPWGSFEQIASEIKRNDPDCFLVFRPHPDVLKGVRPGETNIPSADYCDHFSSTRSLMELAQEVHVINSLTGVEALISGKTVITWGKGWYAGWGLTIDHVQPDRATNATLEQLVHAAYFRHPLYFDDQSSQFITALAAAELLGQRKQEPAPRSVVMPWLNLLPRLFIKAGAAVYRKVSPT